MFGYGIRNVSAGVGMAGKVGISDVARAAGVSISTVSVALNDVEGARINAQTRERIRAVAKSLGYVPNRLAQGLRRQRSGLIGFIGDRSGFSEAIGIASLLLSLLLWLFGR